MLSLFLEAWGASFYLLNKILFAACEGASRSRRVRWVRRAWTAYLLGLPAWIAVFLVDGRALAAAVELSAAPGMILGLLSLQGRQTRVSRTASWMSRLSLFVGIALSLASMGAHPLPIWLCEVVVAAGFLCGTDALARNQARGYLWILVANVACALLSAASQRWLMGGQQLLSMAFVVFALRKRRLRHPCETRGIRRVSG